MYVYIYIYSIYYDWELPSWYLEWSTRCFTFLFDMVIFIGFRLRHVNQGIFLPRAPEKIPSVPSDPHST